MNFLNQKEELLEGGHGLMVDSYSPVLSVLAEGVDIHLNERVTRIKYDFQAVEIHTDEGKVFHADAIIITVPLGVLKANLIKFDPKLPDWKEAAISDLGAGNENKIALFFDSVCWPNVEFLGVVAPTSYGCSYFLNVHKATGHPVLVYMLAGSLADDLEKLSDEAAASFAISQLKKILPHSAEPVRYLVSHWGSEIDSLGSYCYAAVGRPLNLYSRIRSRVENLLFAGEATSSNFPSTVHGAFDTGLMAAYECRRSFEESNPYLSLFQPVMAEVTTSNVPLRISRM